MSDFVEWIVLLLFILQAAAIEGLRDKIKRLDKMLAAHFDAHGYVKIDANKQSGVGDD